MNIQWYFKNYSAVVCCKINLYFVFVLRCVYLNSEQTLLEKCWYIRKRLLVVYVRLLFNYLRYAIDTKSQQRQLMQKYAHKYFLSGYKHQHHLPLHYLMNNNTNTFISKRACYNLISFTINYAVQAEQYWALCDAADDPWDFYNLKAVLILAFIDCYCKIYARVFFISGK